MRKLIIGAAGAAIFVGFIAFSYGYSVERVTDTETVFEDVSLFGQFGLPLELQNWQRPDGPLRVGIQVGHWKLKEVPEELNGLLRSGGAQGGGKQEWEVNLAIAEELKSIFEEEGILVDVLPVTVPPGYFADVFVAIHADGSSDSRVSGFKVAAPWRDFTGKAGELVDLLEEEYPKVTGMKQDFNVSRRMRGYYAFNWRRYEHAVHPMTVAVIMETGFLTNSNDQRILITNPKLAAQGIAEAILKFLDI